MLHHSATPRLYVSKRAVLLEQYAPCCYAALVQELAFSKLQRLARRSASDAEPLGQGKMMPFTNNQVLEYKEFTSK